jgi:phosphotransferase system HPr-like phosphotransfer protein
VSVKILLENISGLPPWALTDLLLIVRQFHCRVSIHNGEITIDGKKMLEVISVIHPELAKVEVNLHGEDEEEAVDYIRNSRVGRFITQSQ